MMNDELKDFAIEATKEVAKDVYNDLGSPVAKPTGEIFGLIPRIIKAKLLPIEKWVLGKEYNLEATRKILEQKLANTPEELIETPEAYVAVPALQNISYCMDNDELREMYANLLASSMNKSVKQSVHPGFVEIIKQMCPDEAKIMKYFKSHNTIPTIDLKFNLQDGSFNKVILNFSNVGEKASCENPNETKSYFDNLIRLGLIENSNLEYLTDKELYKPLKEHKIIKKHIKEFEKVKNIFDNFNKSGVQAPIPIPNYRDYSFEERFIRLTDFGALFCKICIGD